MAQIFHRSTNALSKISIVGVGALIGFLFWVISMINASPFVTHQKIARVQPVPFSHQHHVAGLGIDCRYCHTSVETAAFAGIPPTQTCMNCHSQIWTQAPMLEPVRASFRTGQPIQWTRVHNLPDFVRFNHSIHVNKGVGCVSCHGRVDQMPLMWQEQPLSMQWCLSCHRNPDKHLRPREAVFQMDWKPQKGEGPVRQVSQYRKGQLTNCSVCHY